METPDDVLSNILEYSGKEYLFLSTVSKRFNYNYNEKFSNETSIQSILCTPQRLSNAISCGYKPKQNDLHNVCKYVKEGTGSIVETLLKNGVKWDEVTLITAVEYGNDDYVSWVMSSGLTWTPDTLFCAFCMFDSIKLFDMLMETGYTYPKNCINIAAHYDSKNILKWLSKNSTDNMFMGVLAENGHIDTIRELCDDFGVRCDNHTLNCAATGEFLEVIEYLLNNQNCSVTVDTIYHSSCSSNTEVRNYFGSRYPELYNSHVLDILERYSL